MGQGADTAWSSGPQKFPPVYEVACFVRVNCISLVEWQAKCTLHVGFMTCNMESVVRRPPDVKKYKIVFPIPQNEADYGNNNAMLGTISYAAGVSC